MSIFPHPRSENWKPISEAELAKSIADAREARIERGLAAMLAGDEGWWRLLDSGDHQFRVEAGAVLARLVKALKAVSPAFTLEKA